MLATTDDAVSQADRNVGSLTVSASGWAERKADGKRGTGHGEGCAVSCEGLKHLAGVVAQFGVVHRQCRRLDSPREIFPCLQDRLHAVIYEAA